MTQALLPCPFCGPKSELSGEWPQLFEHRSECVSEWSVRCGCCAVEIGDEDRDEAVRLWNTRAKEQSHTQATPETGWQGMRVKPCALCGEVEELANCATECPERQGVWQKMGEALEELEPLCHSETRQRLLAIIHRGLGRTDDLPPEAELYRQYLAEAPDVAFHTWATTRADLGKAKP